jgi:hypothetical protein
VVKVEVSNMALEHKLVVEKEEKVSGKGMEYRTEASPVDWMMRSQG